LSYLRFTPSEYRALALLCRPLQLEDAFFRDFKAYLVRTLLESLPELAKRVALFTNAKLRILFDHFREQGRKGPAGFTTEELRLLTQACNSLVHPHRFLHYYKHTLVRHFRKTHPVLAVKLARLSEDHFREVYRRVRERRRKG
jgi:hypothetical protein